VVKVLRVGLTPERVAIVAAALAAVRERLAANPALCPMIDTGVQEAEPFVVSAFVDGDSLDVALREYGPANITDALPRMRALADALDSAAAAGVTHGSLHLRDIIVSPEHTVLTGIGVASVLERVGVRPPVRRPYCAPEIAQGHGVSPAGDQFALAAIAHEWLSGRRISGPGAEGFHLPGTSAAGAEAVAAVFCRALDELPETRFPTATAFIDALAEVSDALAPRTRTAKRRPSAVSEPRLAFDFLEDADQAPAATGPRPDPFDDETPALSLAAPDDSDPQDDRATPDLAAANRTEVEPPSGLLLAAGAAGGDADLTDDVVPADDAVAALEAGRAAIDAHPMTDVMAAAPVDVTGPLMDMPDDPRPAEPPRMAPPIVVRPRARAAAPIVPDVLDGSDLPREPMPIDPGPFASSADQAETGWGARGWALALVVLAVVAVTAGAALVRWGTPSRTPSTEAAETPAASTPPPSAPSATPTSPAASPAISAGEAPERAAGSTPSVPSAPSAPTSAPAAAPPVAAAAAPPSVKAVPPRAPARTAAAPAVTAAAPKAKAAAGRLLVRSTPGGAEVFVDGTRRGVTPLAVRDLPFGAHAVRVTRAGFTTAEQRVTVDAGRPSRTVDIALARSATAPAAAPIAASTPGSLTVESRPAGARVIIDGREAGRTPLTVPSLTPGDHAVRIDLDGYQPITTTTRVAPGARARVAVSLTTERPQ
jgi:hypothetical protein